MRWSLLACILSCRAVAAYHPRFYPDLTADQPFVCNWRILAWEFAKKIQPQHDTRITFDALMLGTTCNMTRPVVGGGPSPRQTAAVGGGGGAPCDVFVAVDGNDSHSGTSAATALRSPAAGLAASRVVKPGGLPRVLCLGAGTFFLDAELDLGSVDSHLTIRGSADGQTWLSGAREVPPLRWSKYKVAPATVGTLQTFDNTDNQAGCTPNDPSSISLGGCGCYNMTTTAAACKARCAKLGPNG